LLTVLQEEYVWEIFETCRESQMLGTWAHRFLVDNQQRFSTDPVAYFISPKMWTILNQMYSTVARDHGEASIVRSAKSGSG